MTIGSGYLSLFIFKIMDFSWLSFFLGILFTLIFLKIIPFLLMQIPFIRGIMIVWDTFNLFKSNKGEITKKLKEGADISTEVYNSFMKKNKNKHSNKSEENNKNK